MARSASNKERKTTKNILDGWQEITKLKISGGLSHNEKAKFEKARFAERQNKRSTFVLGGRINFCD